MKRTLAILTVLALATVWWPAGAGAQTKLYAFPYDQPPAELAATAMAVAEGDTEVKLTFGGDCTLGGEASGSAGRFARVMQVNGYGYPLANLLPLFGTDDLTLVNLEGVLSDSLPTPVRKQFNFIGKTAYTAILTLGGVEGVTLANNHALDYGERGKADTVAALQAAGVAYLDETAVMLLDKDGVRVGLTASGMSLNRERWLAQAAELRALGCAAILHVMHMGEEYASTPTRGQRAAAQFLSENGVTLVVGHHPHVVQGVERIGDTTVVYSLGNCVFGGNTDPSDYDACLLRATLRFTDGALVGSRMALWPIRVSGSARKNDYQPVLLSGEEAARVTEKIQAVSSLEMTPFAPGNGAQLPDIGAR